MPYDEQPLRPLDQTEESLVRALAHVMMALPRPGGTRGHGAGDGGLPLSEYTPLMFLSEAPHRRMRMSELATACNLSLSGMTRASSTASRSRDSSNEPSARKTCVVGTPSSPTTVARLQEAAHPPGQHPTARPRQPRRS